MVGREEEKGEVNNNQDKRLSVNILSIEERRELLKIVDALASEYRCDILSCCAYGSKIAGYARPDSDYDILLVLKDYKDIIKYVYMHNRLDASLLIVDGNALLKDAERASLGEFVIGRLLNPYEPLCNVDYLSKAEILYKKRIILEEIDELINTNPLAFEVTIPIEYFLFSKLKKRVRIYPHAVYSYIKTYTGSNAARNITLSKHGFIEAIREIEGTGIVTVTDNDGSMNVKVLKSPMLYSTFIRNESFRGAFAWLVHTYAGRKTLNFFSIEARSKLRRRKEVKEIPSMLNNPSSLLKIDEGVFIDGKDYIKEIVESLDFNDYTYTLGRIGDKHSATMLCNISSYERNEKIVIKYYTDIKMSKWIALNLWLLGIGRRYDVLPYVRMRNEYIGTRKVRSISKDIVTPTIVGVSFKNRVIAFRYVDGRPLSSMIDKFMSNISCNGMDTLTYIQRYASTLALIHKNGFVLRDTKPSNVLIMNDVLCLTDFEQFTNLTSIDDAAWDVACFLYYSLLFTNKYDNARAIIRAFVEGYYNKEVLHKAAKITYCLPFYPALTLGMVKVVRNELSIL